jgi:hypothetical protein
VNKYIPRDREELYRYLLSIKRCSSTVAFRTCYSGKEYIYKRWLKYLTGEEIEKYLIEV